MKKKLLIISSYDEMCGNATYTHSIVRGLSEIYDVEVAALKLHLTQSNEKALIAAGDRHIDEIAERAAKADCVNIQFERGLYAANPKTAAKRMRRLIRASQNVIVTFHRVDPPEFNFIDVLKAFAGRKLRVIARSFWSQSTVRMYRNIVAEMNRKSRTTNTWAIVHTDREKQIFQEIYGLKNVEAYPLTFLFPEDRERYLVTFNRDIFLKKYDLDPACKYIGAFGFFGMYKGYDTLIKALNYLPRNYQILLFGSQHPQSIRLNEQVEASVNLIIKAIEKLPSDVRQRVRFMGSPDDDAFIEALRCVDVVALPYLEVGQGMSGVIALAHEVDANIIAANNISFREFQRYFGSVMRFFDIGNYVEMAQRIVQAAEEGAISRKKPFEAYGLRANSQLHSKLFEQRN